MSVTNEPIIKLEENGKAAIISYNVPEPTSYSGNVFIELNISEDYFNDKAKEVPKGATELKEIDPKSFPMLMSAQVYIPNLPAPPPPIQEETNDIDDNNRGNAVSGTSIFDSIVAGKKQINAYKNLFGKTKYQVTDIAMETRPSIMLVEKYRLNSFLGNYGAGRVLKTFSLLPGEETTININTYKKTETTSKQTSCILDSITDESADDLENTIRSETSDEKAFNETAKHKVNVGLDVTFGSVAKFKSSYEYNQETNQQRKEAVKNINNAVSKHASKASSKRNCEVNISTEVKEQTGEETSIKRLVKNINVSRTLNFVFRQMNQEFITLLCLTDVRLAFFNNFTESYHEAPLYEIDNFLSIYINNNSRIQEVKNKIIEELQTIIDFENKPRQFVTQEFLKNEEGGEIAGTDYLRVKENLISIYKDVTGNEITVEGVIMSAQKNTLRTDGIIVEALLGSANALDEYSTSLQLEAIKEKELKNEILRKELEKASLFLKIIQDKDSQKSTLIREIFGNDKEHSVEDLIGNILSKNNS